MEEAAKELSFIFCRRKFRQQVRPVPGDNAADFVVDDSNHLEAFLDPSADQFEFFRAEGAIV
jgi:hypothetical protein